MDSSTACTKAFSCSPFLPIHASNDPTPVPCDTSCLDGEREEVGGCSCLKGRQERAGRCGRRTPKSTLEPLHRRTRLKESPHHPSLQPVSAPTPRRSEEVMRSDWHPCKVHAQGGGASADGCRNNPFLAIMMCGESKAGFKDAPGERCHLRRICQEPSFDFGPVHFEPQFSGHSLQHLTS